MDHFVKFDYGSEAKKSLMQLQVKVLKHSKQKWNCKNEQAERIIYDPPRGTQQNFVPEGFKVCFDLLWILWAMILFINGELIFYFCRKPGFKASRFQANFYFWNK